MPQTGYRYSRTETKGLSMDMPVEGRREVAYALINHNCDEHRFEKQDLEGHGEDVIEPTSYVGFIHFLGGIISTISCLLPYPLSLSDKEDWPVGFGNSKKYQDQAETRLENTRKLLVLS